MKRALVLGLLLISGLLFASESSQRAGLLQLVETRGSQTSCWGVIVQLNKMRFKKSIAPADLSVKEAKHSSELKDLMVWNIDKSETRLTIKFKQGMGDFGSGNTVTITLEPGAFSGERKDSIVASISTDPL